MLQAVAFLVRDFLRSLLCWWQCHGASRYVTIRLVGQLITVIINGRGGSNPCCPGCQGPPANPYSHRRRFENFFFGKVRTDLIGKTYQIKLRQTRAIAGIVKKTHSTSRLKNHYFFSFMG